MTDTAPDTATAPVDAPAPASPPETAPAPERRDARASALKAFMAKLTRPTAPAPVAVPQPSPDPAHPETAPASTPTTLADLQRADKEAKAAASRVAELESKLAAIEAAEGKRKADPIAALKDLGYTYEDLTRGIVEGKFKALTPEQVALDSTKSEVEKLREKLEAIEAEKRATESQSQRSQLQEAIAAKIAADDVAERLPVLTALPWAAQHLAVYYEANPDADLDEYATQLDASAQADLRATLASDRAIKALLADETVRSRLMAALQPAAPKAPQASLPSSVAGAPGSKRAQSRAVTEAERKARAAAALKRAGA